MFKVGFRVTSHGDEITDDSLDFHPGSLAKLPWYIFQWYNHTYTGKLSLHPRKDEFEEIDFDMRDRFFSASFYCIFRFFVMCSHDWYKWWVLIDFLHRVMTDFFERHLRWRKEKLNLCAWKSHSITVFGSYTYSRSMVSVIKPHRDLWRNWWWSFPRNLGCFLVFTYFKLLSGSVMNGRIWIWSDHYM